MRLVDLKTVILNDNEMSISKNIGGMNKLLTKLRVKNNYSKSNEFWKSVILKIPIIGKPIVGVVNRLKNSLKQLVIPSMFFEDIGFGLNLGGDCVSEIENIFVILAAKSFLRPFLMVTTNSINQIIATF